MHSNSLSSKLAKMPLLVLNQLKPNPGSYMRNKRARQKASYYAGYGNNDKKKWALGYEDQELPEFMKVPKEPYYEGLVCRKEYQPISLLQIQRLIDLNVLDPQKLIDIVAICNTKRHKLNTEHNEHGFSLTDEGIDDFKAQVHIEVQCATEPVIAAVERNGGTVQTKFYDMASVVYASDVEYYFRRARPIPRVKMPSHDMLAYYRNAQNRGYLAPAGELDFARFETSQKYGYCNVEQPFRTKVKPKHNLFQDLQPGWIVDLEGRCIMKPRDEEYLDYYNFEEEASG